ncbi:MAG: hypothetical protein HY921_08245 [Elusimicrobia bacterium]|nr:hypothetical protein [Elusimicrobiota bacterium]
MKKFALFAFCLVCAIPGAQASQQARNWGGRWTPPFDGRQTMSSDEVRRAFQALARDPKAANLQVSLEEIRSIWEATYLHPVAGLDDPRKLEYYDPSGGVGFCYGRAACAVLEGTSRARLALSSMAKLFVVGDLRQGDDPEWRFHVTTLARGPSAQWHAVDPIMPVPMRAEDWMREVRRIWGGGRDIHFYLTPASVIIPDLSLVPVHEEGKRLIEVSFRPERREGFSLAPSLEGAYSPDEARLAEHFQSDKVFNFLGISISDGLREFPFQYNGYFEHLVRSFMEVSPTARPAQALSMARGAALAERAHRGIINKLGLRLP